MQTFKSKLNGFRIISEPTEFVKAKITTSVDSFEYISQFYDRDLDVYESFFILLLNRANNTVGYAKISQGGVTGTVVDIKIVAKYIADSLASAVILAHNHPSGQLIPSQEDRNLTERLKSMAALFDCKVLDHVILAPGNKYYSFADEGII